MTGIENTSDRDPLLHLLGALGGDSDGYITNMEAAGQRQLVASEVIPTEIHGGTVETLTELGFVLGDQVPGDDLFRHAKLPAGWSKQATNHSMHSVIVDELSRQRCGIFYKAAYYDRRADMRIESLSSYAWAIAKDNAPLILDEKWATREGMAAAFTEWEAHEASRAKELRDAQAAGNTRVAEYIEEHEVSRARCAELRAQVEQMGGAV